MRVVFVGATLFGLRCLQLLEGLECCRMVGVVTAPQTFSISYNPAGVKNVLYADVLDFCRQKGIESTVIDGGMKDPVLYERVAAWAPDIFIVSGWYHMIPKSWLKLAPTYGLHASLLPDYSGGAPLVWAIINGEENAGITLFKMDSGVDSGPIVGQLKEAIRSDDTIATLYARIEDRGLELLRQHVPAIADGTAELFVQDESKRRIMPQRSPEDGLIDWRKSAVEVDRFVRAQTRPYPGAFTMLEGKKMTLWKCSVSTLRTSEEPGLVLEKGGRYFVQCDDGALELLHISYSGGEFDSEQIHAVLGDGGQRLV